MSGATDIPDWCFVESGLPYNFEKYHAPTSSELQQMYDASPIKYVSNVKTPVLLCLGAKDLRVPPSTGLEYYHCLRANGSITRLLWYPKDNHSLDRDECEEDMWPNVALWLMSHGFS
eukprot:GSMAST32.ASY1.ANO1.505.1 assembled CDS